MAWSLKILRSSLPLAGSMTAYLRGELMRCGPSLRPHDTGALGALHRSLWGIATRVEPVGLEVGDWRMAYSRKNSRVVRPFDAPSAFLLATQADRPRP